jgi:hypothetical protein
MPEAELQAAVMQLVTLTGCRAYHPWISVRSAAGFPDLTVVHERTGGLLFAELKQDGKQPTTAQAEWLALLGIRHTAVVWTPADLRSGLIARQLQALGRVAAPS